MFLLLAAKKIELDASMDEEAEIEEGLEDLEASEKVGRQGRQSPYWAKIRERLIQFSSTDNVDEAVREWVEDGSPFISHGSCELCDKTPIKFHFPIRNKVTGKGMVVGCECIHNYLVISGYESPGALKKRLVSQLNILRKQEKGEATDDQVAAVAQAYKLEGQLRSRLAAVSGGAADFDMKEYRDALWEVISVGKALNIKDAVFTSAEDAYKATHALRKFTEDTRKKQKSFTGFGLGELVSTINRQRDPQRKVESLERLLRILNTLFQYGMPDEVISRAWRAVGEVKAELLTKVTKKADEGKARLLDAYQDELAMARPYEYLRFLLEAGLEAQRKSFDAQVEKVRAAVEAEDFVDQLKSGSGTVGKLLNMSFYPDLANSEGSAERTAYQVGQFLEAVARGHIAPLVHTIEQTFKITDSVRDWAGVKKALLRAAEDSVVDADVLGVKAIPAFEKEILEKNPKAIAILKEEVDEIAALAKATGNVAVHEAMGKALGFNVEKAYKLYSSKNGFESKFCSDIFERWKSGRMTALSPGQMGNINKQIAMKSRSGEVKDSMWEALKTELTARATEFRR